MIGFSWDDAIYSLNGNADFFLVDAQWKKTWYNDGKIFQEIPGTYIKTTAHGAQNTKWDIYAPKKIDGLAIHVCWKTNEIYDVMFSFWQNFQ